MSPFDAKLYPADVDRAFHPLPKCDAWKAVTLAHIEARGIRIILGCCGCQRSTMVWPRAYAEKHGIAMDMPLKHSMHDLQCKADPRPA